MAGTRTGSDMNLEWIGIALHCEGTGLVWKWTSTGILTGFGLDWNWDLDWMETGTGTRLDWDWTARRTGIRL